LSHGVIVRADELLALSTVLIAPVSRSALPRTFPPTITIDDQPMRILGL
jgi:hypothetical protein